MSATKPVLRISLMGAFKVERDHQLLTGEEWHGRQLRTILKILAARAGEFVSADQLIEQIWPAEDPAIARRNLHVRISQLRHALLPSDPNAYIQTLENGYILPLNTACQVDVNFFQQAFEQGGAFLENGEVEQAICAFEAARNLYPGDFLVEDLYEDWTYLQRERLREQHLELLIDLSECYAQQGRYRRAIADCWQVLDADPCREAVYVRLMLYYYYSGEQDQALRIYENCKLILLRELQVQPLPSTKFLVEQIRSGQLWAVEGAPRYPPPKIEGRLFSVPLSLGHAPFIGRQVEYSWLVERWQQMKAGILWIEGEGGIGKTRLVNEFLGYAETQGVSLLHVRGTQSQALPYSPWIAALRAVPGLAQKTSQCSPYAALLEDLLSEQSCPPPDVPISHANPPAMERQRLFEAIHALLRVGFPERLILFVDDAHQMDQPSLDLLVFLARSWIIVLTCRSEETPPDHPLCRVVQPLRLEKQWYRLKLERLGDADVRKLVQQLAHSEQPVLADQLTAQVGGNPLFIIAWLQHLFEAGFYSSDPLGKWSPSSEILPSIPQTIEQAIRRRLLRLDSNQQRLYDLAAVIGEALDYALLEQAGDLDGEALLTVVDSLIDLGLLYEPRTTGKADLAFAHQTYRTVAYALIPDLRRRKLHHKVAAVLQRTAKDLDTAAPILAYHYQQAGDDAHAFTWLVRAAQAAQARFAHEQALETYQRAVSLNAGDLAPVYEQMGQIAHHLARYSDGVRCFEQALAEWQAQGNIPGQARSHYALAECFRELSQYAHSAAAAQAGLDLALGQIEVPDQARLAARGHIILSNALRSGQLGPPEEIRRHLHTAIELSLPLDDWQLCGEANFWLGVVAINNGDALAALGYDRQALAYFQRSHAPGWQAICHNNLAYHALLAGQPRLALETAQAGLDQARQIGSLHSLGWLLSTLGEAQLHLGELDAARQAFEEALGLVDQWGPPRLKPGLLVDLARLDMACQNWHEAVSRLEKALSLAKQTAPQFIPRLRAALASALLGENQPALAERQALQAQRTARQKSQHSVEGQAWRILGLIHASQDDPEAAARACSQSLQLLESVGDRLEIARTCAAMGKLLSAHGEAQAAQAFTEQARQTFIEMEAVLDLTAL
jgi:DNA-binding SARP family transcriptional activator